MNQSNGSLKTLNSPIPTSSNLESLLLQVARSVERNDLQYALRLADRARRIAPGNSSCVLLYARLLIRTGLAEQALSYLTDDANPEVSIARGEAFCALGSIEKAAQCCQDLLANFSVDGVEGLERLASKVCELQERRAPLGWVGVDDELMLVGEVPRGAKIEVQCPQGTFHTVRAQSNTDTGFDRFTCKLPFDVSGRVIARADDIELLGSSLHWPPPFHLTTWVALDNESLVGEAQFRWSPNRPVSLSISVSNSLDQVSRTIEVNRDSPSGAFYVPLKPSELKFSNLNVTAVLPDGKIQALVGSPLNLSHRQHPAIESESDPQKISTSGSNPQPPELSGRLIDIVVPVYAGHEETLTCLRSLFQTTTSQLAEIVVVNDDSPESQIRSALSDFAAEGRITLLVNDSNLGFPAAANRGLRLHSDRDVILLNSDVEVFGDWVERLRKAAYSTEDVGTVTPLGEAGSITDYSCTESKTSSRAKEIDRVAKQVNAGRIFDLPVGVGFCMYIRRECLAQTGELDEISFGRGYGEENDFCLRASKRGWRHVAAANVFIRHQGGRSFGKVKGVLQKRNGLVLTRLHPRYEALIENFRSADSLLTARRSIDMKLMADQAIKPVLLITHDLTGGVRRYVGERQAKIESEGHTVIVAEPLDSRSRLVKIKLTVASMGLLNLIFDLSTDTEVLGHLLSELQLVHVEIHHFLGIPASLFKTLAMVEVPFDIYAHDYSWICPRVTLIDGSGKYCGEPSLSACEACIRNHGTSLEEGLSVAALRNRSAQWLYDARRLFAPTQDVKERYSRYFPERKFTVTPWETISNPKPLRVDKAAPRTRVALIGAIGVQKGYEVLLECARDAAARDLDLEFTVIGYTVDDQPLLDTGRVFITGPYREEEVTTLLDREQCSVAWIASVSPETWCYTLSLAMDRWLPVLSFDLGAQAERLQSYPNAEILSLDTSAQEVNNALVELHLKFLRAQEDHAVELEAKSETPQSPPIQSANLTSSVQVLKLPQGIYSFSVKQVVLNAATSKQPALPALQVGLAPVRSPGLVEFLSGPSTIDRWLAKKSDMIFVRISSENASLMLTSVREQDSDPLAIGIERLNPGAISLAHQSELIASSHDELPNGLQVRLLAHLRNIGDLEFQNSWAGWPNHNLWIEAFAVASVANLPSDAIEYRGVLSDGSETPWISNQALCGSRGGGSPLVGYAMRLRPSLEPRYQCSYFGRFLSGARVGPLKAGDLCSSTKAGDPLEAIEVRIIDLQDPLLQVPVST